MKRKIIAAIFTGMLTAALFPAIAHAEIENPEDYMGIWYANYVIYSDESSERHNVAEYLNQYLEMIFFIIFRKNILLKIPHHL